MENKKIKKTRGYQNAQKEKRSIEELATLISNRVATRYNTITQKNECRWYDIPGENLPVDLSGMGEFSNMWHDMTDREENTLWAMVSREQNWKSRVGINKADIMDLKRFSKTVSYMQQKGIVTVSDLEIHLEKIESEYNTYRSGARSLRKESGEIGTTIRNMERYKELQSFHDKYSRTFFKKAKEKYYREHKAELDEWSKLNRFAKKKFPDPSQYNRQELETRQAELGHRITRT